MRWDTPQHVLADDVAGTEGPEIWPGKDYSNPRIADFCELDKPDQDMYDRTKVPRMPWYTFLDFGMILAEADDSAGMTLACN